MPTKLGQYIALNPKIRPEERDALENVLTNDPDKLQQFIQLDARMSDPEKDQLFGVFKSEMTPAQPGWGDVLTNIGTRAYGQMTEGVAGVAEAGAELVGGDPTAARNLRLYGRELAQPLPGSSSTQQFVSDVGSNVLSFAPALLAGGGAVAAGRKALGMAIPIVYGGIHSAGAEYGLAREKGYTPTQAAGVSAAAGASSAGWMALPIGQLFNKGGKSLVAKMLGMVVPAGAAGAGMSLTHRGIEGFADSLADKQGRGLLPPDYTLGDAAKEAMYSGAVGVGIGLTTAAGEHVLGFSNKAARKELESRDAKLSVDEQDVTRYLENNPDVTPEERAGFIEALKRSTDERDAIAAELGEPRRGEVPATSAQLDRIANRLNVLEPEIQKRLGDRSIPAEVRKSLSDGLDRLTAEYDVEAERVGAPNWESTRAEVPPVAGPKPDSMTAPGRELQPPTRFTTPEGEPGTEVVPPPLWGDRTEAPPREIPPMTPEVLKDVLAGKVPSIPPTEETSATERDKAQFTGEKWLQEKRAAEAAARVVPEVPESIDQGLAPWKVSPPARQPKLRMQEARDTQKFDRPIIDFIAENGSIIPKTKAKPKDGSYDDAPSMQVLGPQFSGKVFGGKLLLPDQMAQRLYNEGLISSPDPTTMWRAVEKEVSNKNRNSSGQGDGEHPAVTEWKKYGSEEIDTQRLKVGDQFTRLNDQTLEPEVFTVLEETDMALRIKGNREDWIPYETGKLRIDKGSLVPGETSPKVAAALEAIEQQRLEAEKLRNTPEGEEFFPKVEAQEKVEGHSQAYLDETNRLLDEARASVKARKGSEPTSAETAEEYITRNPDRALGGLGRKGARAAIPEELTAYVIDRSVEGIRWAQEKLAPVFRMAVEAVKAGKKFLDFVKAAGKAGFQRVADIFEQMWADANNLMESFGRRGAVGPDPKNKEARADYERFVAWVMGRSNVQETLRSLTESPGKASIQFRDEAGKLRPSAESLKFDTRGSVVHEYAKILAEDMARAANRTPGFIKSSGFKDSGSISRRQGGLPPSPSGSRQLDEMARRTREWDWQRRAEVAAHDPAMVELRPAGRYRAYGEGAGELLNEARRRLVIRGNANPSAREIRVEAEDINANDRVEPITGMTRRATERRVQATLDYARSRGREPVFSVEYLIARKSVAAVKWLGTRLESVFRSAVDALGRGADYFSWAKDAVRRFGVGIVKTARDVWRSAVSGYREFTADLGRRGAVISPEKMAEILSKSGEPTKKLTEKEIVERRPFTEGQMAQAIEAGGLKAVQQSVGNDRTALVDMFGRAANILGEVATPKELADILNVMDYNQLKHKALQSGLTAEQREQRKIPFTDPNTGKTVPGKTEGPVTWAEQDRFARLSGKSWVDAANKFHADPTRPLGIVDETLLLRGVEAAHTILSAAQTVATNNPNSPKAQESMVMARNLYDAVMGARLADGSLYGRGLNAAKRVALPERNLGKLRRMIESQDVELTKAQNDFLAKLDPKNPRYIDHAKRILGLDTFAKFYAFYLGNILSGLTTHIRNGLSGLTSLTSQVGESGVAAMLDIALGRTKETGRSLMDPVTLMLAYADSAKDAGRVAFQAFFEGAPPEGLNKLLGPVESKAVKALTSDVEMQSLVKGEMMPRAIQGFVSKNPDALWRMVETPLHVLSLGGRVPQVTGNLLRAVDLFFRLEASMGKLKMDAVRAARKSGLTPAANPKEFVDFVTERMTSPSPEALEAAAKEGMNRVFADPIQQDAVKWLLRAKASNSFIGRVLQLLLPFVKTPYNIFKQGIERSPLGFAEVLERMKMDPAKGGLTREMLADELAKPVLGTILMGTAAYAVAMGWMTGAGPRDKAERERERAAGRQPYSWLFKMNGRDRYVGFDSMEPLLGTTMSMMVDAAEAMMRTPKDASTKQIIQEAVYGTLGAVVKNLHNKTFLRGFWNGIDAASDPDRYMEGFVENFARGVAPASGLRKGMQNAIDPTRYRVDGPVDSYWAMFPTMAANGYLPDLDWLGRPKQMGAPADGVLGATFRLLSPVQYSEESQDPADLLANALGIDKSKPVARLQGGKVELDPIQHNEYIRAQGLLAHRLLTGMAKNILPRVDTMSTRQKELLKKRIESTISGYRQNVVRNLTMKWKREGMK